jgi:hypothetical protein
LFVTKDHLATALVRQGGAVPHQLIGAVLVLGLFEFEVLILDAAHPRLEL